MVYNEIIECSNCDGTGIVYISCCGDDMRPNINETDLCPTCMEHCGNDGEDCEECNGTGTKRLITKGLFKNFTI